MEYGWWGARDHSHAMNSAVAHCKSEESHFYWQNMLLGVVERVGPSLERVGFAAHSLDANWWDIEGAEQVDSWVGDSRSFYDLSSERCDHYRAVRSACCLHPRRNCRSVARS